MRLQIQHQLCLRRVKISFNLEISKSTSTLIRSSRRREGNAISFLV
uniref:Uncharacterized protein n=1 Tax=Nelumbo nucifera TaxID=4432 RepID=A0A822XJS0_NELNU|nr:TPA_asm: hypothetical protein HUJ06_023257 [Nelumbo nucifera]